jgi:two-component system KDP operon response regulator KdpE
VAAAAEGATGGGPRRKGDGWPRAPRHGAGWPRVLVADDDPAIRRYLTRHLPSADFVVLGLNPDHLEVERLRQLRPDAIVVGTDAVTDPDMGLLRMARQASRAPALVLLGNESPRAVIETLDLGASDCLAKPFLLGELAARLRKTLRQALTDKMPWHTLRTGDLEIDFVRGIARLRGEDVALTRMEHWVLRRLAEAAGNVVSARSLLADGWATDDVGKAQRVRRVVQALRAKLRLDQTGAAHIVSEASVGYRLRLPEAARTLHVGGAVG